VDAADFFQSKQGAAVLKHEVLSNYLPQYVFKTGSTCETVVFLDGYAGPGQYQDGSGGSPSLAVGASQKLSESGSAATLKGLFVERDRTMHDSLVAYLDGTDFDSIVWKGDLRECWDEVMAEVPSRASLFAFIDPFGLSIRWTQLKQLTERGGKLGPTGRASGGAPTEILMNFSLPGIRRVAGHLTSNNTGRGYVEKTRPSMLARMDDAMGGQWWRDIWCSGGDNRADEIAEGFIQRVTALRGGWNVLSVPVSDRWEGPPSYYLLLLTQHPDGIWMFNNSISTAVERFRDWADEKEASSRGDQQLLEFETPAARKDRLARSWVDEIKKSIARRLAVSASMRPGDDLAATYGEALGDAREMHLRTALRELFDEGVTTTNPYGVKRLQWFVVRPA
jgi:three-Cys-motif partner protein